MTDLKRSLSWLGGFLKGYRRQIVVALLLGLATYGCAALLMFTSGYLIAKTADPVTTLFMVMTPVAFVQLFGIGRPVCRYFERLTSHDWVFRITSKLRLGLFQAAERAAADPARSRATGEYLNMLNGDIGHLQNLFLRVVFPALIALLLFAGACILCGVFSVQLLLLMLMCGAACVFVLPYLAIAVNRTCIVRMQESRNSQVASLTDDIMGIADWIIAGQGVRALDEHAAALHDIAEQKRRIRLRTRIIGLISLLAMGAILCAILCTCGELYGGTPGQADYIAAFALGFFPLIEVFALLPAALSESVVHDRALSNLGELMQTPAPDSQQAGGTVPAEPATRTHELPAVAAKDLVYRYPHDSVAVLDGLRLTVPVGQKIAILGRSGSGKSTLAALLRGDLPGYQGTAELFGYPVSTCGSKISSLVGYLSQDPYIFNRTLRQNLQLDRTDITDEQLSRALHHVGLGAKLNSLPRGLDTLVGETGIGFSGGEAHRLALARVLLSPAPLIILDEPFSALDTQTEQALLQTMFDVLKGRTLIVITHHLAQIDQFDRVVFIEDGKVSLDGSPVELQVSSEYFKNLLASDRSL